MITLHLKRRKYFLRYFYPALMGNKTPPQNAAKAKKLGGGRAAHKSPIGEG
ncbi:hypothetical protein ABH961_001912 [Bacillus sp. RC251]